MPDTQPPDPPTFAPTNFAPRRTFDLDAYAEAAAALLGLDLDHASREAVTANLRVLAAAADLVAGLPLPDEAEAAPRFEA